MIEKKNIKLVMTGDSMTQSFGAGASVMADALAEQWPEKEFDVINQGVGGTRVGYGLWRLHNEYEVDDKKYPAMLGLNPDIVLLESFAYNNATDGLNETGFNHFRDMHTQIVETLREKTNAEIVFVATFAPDLDHFLESVPAFFNTPVSIRKRMAEERMVYLEEAIKLAGELGLPVANVYQRSLENEKNGISLASNIDPEDWIHPSKKGLELVANEVVKTLSKGIIE